MIYQASYCVGQRRKVSCTKHSTCWNDTADKWDVYWGSKSSRTPTMNALHVPMFKGFCIVYSFIFSSCIHLYWYHLNIFKFSHIRYLCSSYLLPSCGSFIKKKDLNKIKKGIISSEKMRNSGSYLYIIMLTRSYERIIISSRYTGCKNKYKRGVLTFSIHKKSIRF